MARRDPPVRHTEQDISEAALKLFCERGYHAVTVEEIASAAGVTKGAFLLLLLRRQGGPGFADKEDLAEDLWQELWGRLAEAAGEVFEEGAPLAANVKRCFGAALEAISGLGEARFFLREAWVLPKVEVAGRADQQAAAALIGSLLGQAAQEALWGLDIDAASAVLLGAYAEAMLHIPTTGDPEPTLEVLDRVIDALVPSAPGTSRPPGRRPGGTRAGRIARLSGDAARRGVGDRREPVASCLVAR